MAHPPCWRHARSLEVSPSDTTYVFLFVGFRPPCVVWSESQTTDFGNIEQSQHSRKRNAEKGINQTFSNTNHYQVAQSTRAKLVITPSTTMNAAATVCAAAICSPSTSPRSVHQRRCDRPVRQNRLSLLTKASVENTASSVGVTQRVLITGSPRGLGFELARSFLARGA